MSVENRPTEEAYVGRAGNMLYYRQDGRYRVIGLRATEDYASYDEVDCGLVDELPVLDPC
jgi:hypothetical protein